MKNKGFTLIELITVIAFLSIFMVITIAKINNSIKETRADQLEEVRETIANATDVYLNSSCGSDYNKKLIQDNIVKIYLNNISNCGLIENMIYNPVADNYFDINNEYIIVKKDEVGMIEYELSF